MNSAGRGALVLYQEILAVFFIFLIGFIIYAGIKRLLREKTGPEESALRFFVARLNFAVVFFYYL